jgi:hypothetical protein
MIIIVPVALFLLYTVGAIVWLISSWVVRQVAGEVAKPLIDPLRPTRQIRKTVAGTQIFETPFAGFAQPRRPRRAGRPRRARRRQRPPAIGD